MVLLAFVTLLLYICRLSDAISSDTLLLYGGFVEDLYEKASFDKLPNDGDYQVTRNLYATESTGIIFGTSAVWIGYTAISSSKNDIAVVLRGTLHFAEWIENLMVGQVQFQKIDGSTTEAYVHHGFMDLYTASDASQDSTKTSLRQQLMDELSSLLSAGNYGTITLVGHSLGGALSILSAFDIANSPLSSHSFSMHVYTFASPMVGDSGFKQSIEGIGNLDILRMADIRDVVPYLPSLNYEHAGQELSVDGCKYDIMGVIDKIIGYHSLKRYLNTVHQMTSNMGQRNVSSDYPPEDFGDVFEFVKMIISSVKSGEGGLTNLISAMHTYVDNFTKSCDA